MKQALLLPIRLVKAIAQQVMKTVLSCLISIILFILSMMYFVVYVLALIDSDFDFMQAFSLSIDRIIAFFT